MKVPGQAGKVMRLAICVAAVLIIGTMVPAYAGDQKPDLKTRVSITSGKTFNGQSAKPAERGSALPGDDKVAKIAGHISAPAIPQSSSSSATAGMVVLPNHPISNYTPITAAGRFNWFMNATTGPSSLLLSGTWSAAWGTMLNSPEEYGPHWEGFGARYGMRLTGVSTGNATEAMLGTIWKEDPRYFRSENRAFGARVKHVIVTTFTAPGPDGRFRPAYARYAGNVFNNFLSNTWRVPSESDPTDAAVRCAWGVLGRMAGDAFLEFWPDVRKAIFKK